MSVAQIKNVEKKLKNQIKRNNKIFDLKVDLKSFINKNKNYKKEHTFRYEIIGKKDALLIQSPNINESGYYAGIVALKSYVDKYHPELKVEIVDPVIDYFYVHPPDKQSDFFNMFNTYAKQGKYELLFDFREFNEMVKGYLFPYIDKSSPKLIGFSVIDGNIDATLAMSKMIKDYYPHIKIAIGGNGVEIFEFGRLPGSYKFSNYPFIDVISRGDGEETFVEILKSDFSEKSLQSINGIVWKMDGMVIHNQNRDNISMEKLPFPDYSPLQGNWYYEKIYSYNVPIILSRGCPYRCSFCSVPEFIPLFRYRSLDSVMDELEYWVGQGKRYFFCHDSIINGNPKWLQEFSKRIIDKGWGDGYINWGGNMRLQENMRDIEVMRLYYRAGLTKMITGFESGSENVLKHMKKYTKIEGVWEIFDNVRKINEEYRQKHLETGVWYEPMLFAMQVIVGYLNETEEDFLQTLNFIEKNRDVMSEILTCSAFLLHQTLLDKWKLEGEYIEFYNTVNFVTKYNTPQERLKWLGMAEDKFKELGISYNIYNRGLYHELIDKK